MLSFQRFGRYTVFAVYFLILVGGIVRSTGAGMGCPDWPLCFGEVIPPTDESQLPANYADKLLDKRKEKNENLVATLDRMGLSDMLESRPDHDLDEKIFFSVEKAWIEYLNRLTGVVIGIFVFGTLLLSFKYFKKDKLLIFLSFLAFALVGVEGWLGSLVVSSNLLPGMISVHMLLALVIVLILIYAVTRSEGLPRLLLVGSRRTLNLVLLFALGLMFVQLLLGIEVRELMDVVQRQMGVEKRMEWVSNLGNDFLVHRSFSWALVIAHVALLYLLRKEGKALRSSFVWLFVLVMIEVVAGIGMAYFGVPGFLQPVHLLVATMIIGLQFYLLLKLNPSWLGRRMRLA